MKKYPSMRSIHNELGNDIPDLIQLGEMLKYKYGGPGADNPTPEALKNYMDVSITADLSFFNGFVKECFFLFQKSSFCIASEPYLLGVPAVNQANGKGSVYICTRSFQTSHPITLSIIQRLVVSVIKTAHSQLCSLAGSVCGQFYFTTLPSTHPVTCFSPWDVAFCWRESVCFWDQR